MRAQTHSCISFRSIGVLVIVMSVLTTGCYASDEGYSFGARFLGGGGFGGFPVLTPDGQAVVFSSPSRKGAGDLWEVSVDGQTKIQLTSAPYFQGEPDVSPDGKTIVFVSEETGVPHICTMSRDGRNIRRITRGKYPEYSPRFSPHGSKIAFTRHMDNDPDALWSDEIFLIDADGSNERRLTRNRIADLPVGFSPDGTFLYTSSPIVTQQLPPELASDVKRIEINSAAVEQVLRLDAFGASDISADGAHFLFLDDPYDYDVFRCSIDGSDQSRLTDLKGAVMFVRFGVGSSKTATFVLEPTDIGYPERAMRAWIYTLDVTTGKSLRVTQQAMPESDAKREK